MSHFSVLVVGDVEFELEPFQEFEALGEENEFVDSIESPDCLANVLALLEEGGDLSQIASNQNVEILRPGEIPRPRERSPYGYIEVDENDTPVRYIMRTNPNAKWDWYEIGGRFAGLLIDNQGYHVNSCRKGDIDWEGVKREAREEAAEEYEETYRILNCEVGAWTSFTEMIDQVARENPDMPNDVRMNEARRRYWSQPAFSGKELYRLHNLDKFRCSLEEYVRNNSLCAPFAFVKDRNWIDRSQFDKDVNGNNYLAVWEAAVEKLMADLHDDEIITLVDCHI